MTCLTNLDDLALEGILAHLRYIDLFNLSLTCRVLREVVYSTPVRLLNCTKSFSLPILQLPYAAEHRPLGKSAWQLMKREQGTTRQTLYFTDLYWTSKQVHFNPLALREVILDGTRINVLDVIYFITNSPHLAIISLKFCSQVKRLHLQNYLDSLVNNKQEIVLRRLDVLGIDGIPFFEPLSNGPEFDYSDEWRQGMYDFKMSLERVPTQHGNSILSDIARCSQRYCRNFDVGRLELADPTIQCTLPTCYICGMNWSKPICRHCIGARSCKLCATFICPNCYCIDDDLELYNFASEQRWMDDLTGDVARAGQSISRNCHLDMKTLSCTSPKACLLMQRTHSHIVPMETAALALRTGYNLSNVK